jgi:putative spermidine/putrescine transport system substrate-binding protein
MMRNIMRGTRRMRRGAKQRVALAVAMAGLVGITACGSDKKSSPTTSAAVAAPSSVGPTTAASDAPATSAAAKTSAPAAEELSGDLVYTGFGGALGVAEKAAFFDGFQKLHPKVKITYDEGADFAKLKAMVETGNVTWDVYTGDLFAPDPSKFFEKINCTIVPCDQIISDTNISQYVQIFYTYSNLITYDPSKFVSGHPTTWAEFFDTKTFPGKRALPKTSANAMTMFTIALLADGVPKEKLFPLDYDRAIKKLNSIKSDIVYYDTNAQCPQLIRDGEATMGMCLTGRVVNAIKDGANLEMEWNQNISGSGAVSIVKGTKNLPAAQAFVAYMLSADANPLLSKYIAYGPTNKNSFKKTNPDIAKYLLSSHQDAESVSYNWPYARENGPDMTDRFDKWLQS